MSEVPVFAGGFRSGSTLLINLLGLHPQVAPWFETKSVCEALRWQRVLQDPATEAFERYVLQPQVPAGFTAAEVTARMGNHMRHTAGRIAGALPHGKADHERYPLGTDHVLYSLADAETALQQWRNAVGATPTAANVAAATGALIRQLGSRQTGLAQRPLWINKTPEMPRFGNELRQCLGRCRIIHLIRDGRKVARSAMALGWGDVHRMARLWKEMIELSRDGGPCADYLEVRYEDLVSKPGGTLDRVLGFLELEPMGDALWEDYRRRVRQPFRPPRHQPEQQLQDSELRAFNAIAGDLLQELGYT